MSGDSDHREPYLEQPQDQEQPHYTVGRRLREARETLDLDLREVASQLRIRPFYLQAIEDARYEDLPGSTYAIGFVRAYADYLRLDSRDLVKRFKAEVEGLDTRRSLHFPVPPQEGRVPGVAILLVAILLGAAGYGVWYYLGQEGRSFTEVVDPLPQDLAELAGGSASSDPATSEANPTGALPEAQPAPAAPLSPSEPEAQPLPQPAETAVEPTAPETAETIDVAPAPGAQPSGDETQETASAPEAPVEGEAAERPTAIAGASKNQALGTLPADTPIVQGPAEPSAPAETPIDSAADLLAQDQTGAPEQIEEEAEPAAAQEASAPPAPEPVAPAPPAPSAGEAEEAPEGRVYGAVNESARVVLLAEADSWVEVRDGSGRLVLSRVLREGDSFRVPDQQGLVMMTGNAGGLQITVDGRSLPKLGEQGQVRRDIALEPTALLALLPQ